MMFALVCPVFPSNVQPEGLGPVLSQLSANPYLQHSFLTHLMLQKHNMLQTGLALGQMPGPMGGQGMQGGALALAGGGNQQLLNWLLHAAGGSVHHLSVC